MRAHGGSGDMEVYKGKGKWKREVWEFGVKWNEKKQEVATSMSTFHTHACSFVSCFLTFFVSFSL